MCPAAKSAAERISIINRACGLSSNVALTSAALIILLFVAIAAKYSFAASNNTASLSIAGVAAGAVAAGAAAGATVAAASFLPQPVKTSIAERSTINRAMENFFFMKNSFKKISLAIIYSELYHIYQFINRCIFIDN